MGLYIITTGFTLISTEVNIIEETFVQLLKLFSYT